jgi:hypothetical protein
MFWWKSRRHHGEGEDCGAWAGPGEGEGEERGWGRWRGGWHGHEASHDDGGAFGVRRPLRFLAYKLHLSETQVGELARILNELKTERAQAEVDGRRTIAGFADAVAGATFDGQRAEDAGKLRVESAERLKKAVIAALGKIHALLDEEQRARLAYLIRTGVLSI